MRTNTKAVILAGVLAAACFAAALRAQTNFISIPWGHATVTNQWWTNPVVPVYVTNWQAWQAENENWRRASNALAGISDSLSVTNFLALRTNYLDANFVPVSGLVKICASNNALYMVTTGSTNLISLGLP